MDVGAAGDEVSGPIRDDGVLTPYQRVVIRRYLARRELAAKRALAHYCERPADEWTEGTLRAQQHWLAMLACLRWCMPPEAKGGQ
jgi:hypothetical protein